jgi:uncharacterized sulfatase
MHENRMTRRSFLKLGGAAAIGLSGAGIAGCGGKNDCELTIDPAIYDTPEKAGIPIGNLIRRTGSLEGRPPNIIIILCDDLGYGDLGCYGSTAIKTPNLDRMAATGMRFTDFYASNALCSPSRAGLLTGRYPHRTGVTFPVDLYEPFLKRMGISMGRLFFFDLFVHLGAIDGVGARSIVQGLPLSEITIASALKVAGYRSAAIGKWHLGDFTEVPQYHPYRHGFDYFAGFPGVNDDPPKFPFWRGEQEIVHNIGLAQEPYTGIFTQEAVSFIERSKDGPFFLYFAHKDPHQPNIPSKRFKNSSDAGRYGDTVQEIDWSTGEILKCLERTGLINDTLILFTSDNGAFFNGSNGILRGGKGQSYEGGLRVPMIATWPGHIPSRSICSEPVMNIDFFPTCLGLAGLTPPSDRIIDGRDMTGLLKGKEKRSPHDALFFFHHNEIEGVRQGDWKYFRRINHAVYPVYADKNDSLLGSIAGKFFNYTDRDSDGRMQTVPFLGRWPLLYNMGTDPGERYNLIDKYPETGNRMLGLIESCEQSFALNPRGWINK